MYFRSKVWIPYKSGFYPDYACFAWSFNSFRCIRSAWICKDRYSWRVTARACCCCLLTSGDDDVQEVLESLHRAVCLRCFFFWKLGSAKIMYLKSDGKVFMLLPSHHFRWRQSRSVRVISPGSLSVFVVALFESLDLQRSMYLRSDGKIVLTAFLPCPC